MHGNDDKRFRPLDGLRGVAVLAVLTAAIPEAGILRFYLAVPT